MASCRDLEEEGVALGQQRASSSSSFSTNEFTPLLQSPVPELSYAVLDIIENPRITYTTRGRADTIATSSTDTAVDSNANNANTFDDADQEQYNSLLEARRKRLKPKIIPLCLGAMFLLELSVALSVPPTNAVEESIICRNFHPDVVSGFANNTASILLSDNPVCKEEDVQSYLAMLQGWQATFDCIPSILMTVPFGILSDKWGRRPVLSLAMSGAVFQMFALATILFLPNIFPIWTVWLTSSFLLIGGGGGIIAAMLYTFISDIVPIAERATLFFQMHATYLTARMISGPIAGSLMAKSPWIPLLLSLGLITLAAVTTLIFPETRHLKAQASSSTKRLDNDNNIPTRLPTDDEDIDKPMISSSPSPLSRLSQPQPTVHHRLTTTLHSLTHFLATNNNRKICILTLALGPVVIGKYAQALLLQYATKRFGYTWSEASYLLTIPHFTSLITLLVILPFVSSLLLGTSPLPLFGSGTSTSGRTRFHLAPFSALKKDLALARTSSLLLTSGCLLIALASSRSSLTAGMVLFALGSGLGSTIRSLLNALVDEQHMGLVNSVVGWLEMVGIMVAGPVLAEGMSEGLRRGGGWVGLPFWMAGGLLAGASGLVWVVRVGDGKGGKARMGEGDGGEEV
ncbi:major facilitator superfamily domain-containing protein [Pseudoneurospora amorphoporcata]|uniref:Major facilitator superfamily domain-containing protein n=1 Tax=Pseudoneurospora amorphoporcata TaxID=241081 RepID=A0AAN6SDS7_9PEZI|nr:major facilitator superfamily domain-containing protein [Pseudoneurospora amorphoporcata]